MTTLKQNSEFKILFNGSTTYMIVDNNGDCWKTLTTERTANNYFNKVSKLAGVC